MQHRVVKERDLVKQIIASGAIEFSFRERTLDIFPGELVPVSRATGATSTTGSAKRPAEHSEEESTTDEKCLSYACPLLSRNHAEIFVIVDQSNGESQLYIKDLGSSNGTFVNMIQLKSHESRVLHDMDQLSFGGLPDEEFGSDDETITPIFGQIFIKSQNPSSINKSSSQSAYENIEIHEISNTLIEAIEIMKSTQVKLDQMELVVNDVLKKNDLAQTALVCDERRQGIIDILHELKDFDRQLPDKLSEADSSETDKNLLSNRRIIPNENAGFFRRRWNSILRVCSPSQQV